VDNTQRFVDTLGPLASNPKIQELVINEVTNKLDETVDFAGTTSSLIDGLGSALSLPPSAKDALGLFSDPLAAGVKGLVREAVGKVVNAVKVDVRPRRMISRIQCLHGIARI
jgi:hypothetical protein